MNLDLKFFASTKRPCMDSSHDLDYLLNPVRKELEQRLIEVQDQIETAQHEALILDFKANAIDLSVIDHRYKSVTLSLSEGDFEFDRGLLNLENSQFDIVIDNLHLSWLEPVSHINEVFRILKPGGVYLFSCFGPDTLYEIVEAWHGVDDLPHVHDTVDMHHLGDRILKTGFVKPIVDADWSFIDYPDMMTLFYDLKAAGFSNIHPQRRKTLMGKSRFERFQTNLEKSGENLRITFEIIYGFGKKPLNSNTGEIRVEPPRL